jgi:hypothetical protein
VIVLIIIEINNLVALDTMCYMDNTYYCKSTKAGIGDIFVNTINN